MRWKNKLEQQIKNSLNVPKAIIPDDTILRKSGTSESRFRFLLKNKVKMTALELLVFCDWLSIEPNDMIAIED